MRKIVICLGIVVLFLTRFQFEVQAAAGDLDVTFGIGGKVAEQTDPICISDTALTLQSDEKILVGGNCSSRGFTVARYLTNGSLDPDFGINGLTTSILDPDRSRVNSVAVLADGKIIAGGTAGSGNAALVRYHSDGNVDTTFGINGTVVEDLSSSINIHKVLVLPDGKILVGGEAGTNSGRRIWVGRYDSDGNPDLTFGTDGKVFSDRLSGDNNQPRHPLAVQSDGKIIVIGYIITADPDFGFERYEANGTIDTTFGINGLVTTDFGGSEFNDVLHLQPDDKILIGGSSNSNAGFHLALSRYNSDGALDTGFGAGGMVTLQIGIRGSSILAIAVQPDGKIIGAGAGDPRLDEPLQNLDFALLRFQNNGILDSTFGQGGMVFTDFGGTREQAFSVAIQNDKKIVLNGVSASNINGFVLARYLGDEETPQYQFSGFLPPLTADSRTVFKLGSVIPVKFQLFDENSLPVSTAIAHLSLQKISGTEPVGDPIDASSVSNADTGNQFRYSDDQYIYNLNTKPLSSGTWQLRAMLDDGSTHTIQIDLKSK